MDKWIVCDRHGQEVYLTGERWQHILSRHKALASHRDDVLSTIRTGRRRQDLLTPFKYFYSRRCDTLPGLYNSITVVVLSRPDNVYVVTAWPETV
ncbi:MAG: hypothetical protein QMD04_01495 [Anaerolineales bacterium]|nr:hypothetical protein [Anaerolineales bacterium]